MRSLGWGPYFAALGTLSTVLSCGRADGGGWEASTSAAIEQASSSPESAPKASASSATLDSPPEMVAWQLKDPGTVLTPSARYRHRLAYDSARQKIVLFGGQSDNAYLDDTWEWDGLWTNVTPADPLDRPSARSRHALAYDSSREKVVLFGGYSVDGYLDDTWEWDGTDWTRMDPATSPLARAGHALTYDSARGKIVLFGRESA